MSPDNITWQSKKAELLADPGFVREYEKLRPEFELVSKLIALRQQLGLSQREFAQRIGIKQPALARLESGRQVPKLETLQKLVEGAGYRLELRFVPRTGEGGETMSVTL